MLDSTAPTRPQLHVRPAHLDDGDDDDVDDNVKNTSRNIPASIPDLDAHFPLSFS